MSCVGAQLEEQGRAHNTQKRSIVKVRGAPGRGGGGVGILCFPAGSSKVAEMPRSAGVSRDNQELKRGAKSGHG